MRSFAKNTPPQEIRARAEAWQREYEQNPRLLDSADPARTRFNALDKQPLREAVVGEQTGLCAFCLGRIRPWLPRCGRPSGTVLAHVVPVREDPRSVFDWGNLLGSCDGGSGSARHCDNAQGEQVLFINPAGIPGIERYIRYATSGRIHYRGPTLFGRTKAEIQAEFDDVLKLNIERLRENRKAVLDNANRRMNKIGWSLSNIDREIRHWSAPDSEGHYTPYFCVAVDYLQRKRSGLST